MWEGRVARLPWTKIEIKAHLKRRYQGDEKKVISILASEGSGACEVHQKLRLSRQVMKAATKSLDHCRRQQQVLASIACGTFFKYYDRNGVRLQVKCPICSEVCTFLHLLSHVSVEAPVEGEEDEMVEFPIELTKIANPAPLLLPTPIMTTE